MSETAKTTLFDTQVPYDPERLLFSDNKLVRTIQKYRHYAIALLGLTNIQILTSRKLVVVPEKILIDALKAQFPDQAEAIDAIAIHSGRSDHQPPASRPMDNDQ